MLIQSSFVIHRRRKSSEDVNVMGFDCERMRLHCAASWQCTTNGANGGRKTFVSIKPCGRTATRNHKYFRREENNFRAHSRFHSVGERSELVTRWGRPKPGRQICRITSEKYGLFWRDHFSLRERITDSREGITRNAWIRTNYYDGALAPSVTA